MLRRVERVLKGRQTVDPPSTRSEREASGADTTSDNHVGLQSATESDFGLKVLADQPAGNADAVDIIAIHGLNGRREKTWADETTSVNWLADSSCLRKDVPRARIFTFGYNSASYFSRSDANIQDFASELLADVKASRASDAEKRRPLIFICHSLGGLVFKQVKANQPQSGRSSSILNKYRSLFEPTNRTDSTPTS